MAHAVRMPKPGQMTEECTVVAWHKAEGDPVRRGDVLFEIETDKSTMEVEAFDAGTLLRRVVEEGAVVPVNAICAWIGEPGEEPPAGEAVLAPGGEAALAPGGEPTPPAEPATAPVAEPGTPAESAPAREPVPSPALPPALPTPGPSAEPAPAPDGPGRRRLAISPRASRLAAEANLDRRSLVGTGPGGRIVERDVRAAITAREAAASAAAVRPPAAASSAAAPAAALHGVGEDEPRPLSRMRRVIAERLTLSATTIPHFTVTVAVDVTGLLALRQELRAAGTSLSVTDFVLAATAQTLAEFPDVNSRTDGTLVWPRRRVHLGVAVAVPGGLVVPVIRDADRLGLGEIHDRAAALAIAAREGALGPDDLAGSTFTVSNLGMFGVDAFTAIINPGEAAILAVAAAVPTAVAIGDGLAVRSIMKLTLSADHRLVDGEMGARFLGALRRRLEDVASFRSEASLI
jgi:pyruvate dehydrogenase E2 component (dihydrolipoamide acetyltransferase)